MANKNVEEIVQGFAAYLVKNHQEHLLPEIIKVLSSQFGFNTNVATVISAVSLPTSQKTTIGNLIKKDYAVKEVNFEVDPSLLGGLKIMLGDSVLDLSTKAKLDTISNGLQS